jgi:predicted ATPase
MTYKDEKTSDEKNNIDGVYIKFNQYSDGDSIIPDDVSADEIEKNVPSYYKKTGINFRKPEGIKYDSGFIPCKLKYPFELSDEFIGRVVDLFIEIITDDIHYLTDDILKERIYGWDEYNRIARSAKGNVNNLKMSFEGGGGVREEYDFPGREFANFFNMGFLFYNRLSDLDKSIAEKVTRGRKLDFYNDDWDPPTSPSYVPEDNPQGLAIWYQDVLNLNDEDKNEIFNKIKGESFKKALKEVIRTSFGTVGSAFPYLDRSIDLPESKLKEACVYLNKYFNTKIKYLGPLREKPKDVYEFKNEYNSKEHELLVELAIQRLNINERKNLEEEFRKEKSDIGVKGERTAEVITLWHNNQWMVTNYYSPPSLDIIEKPKNTLLIDTLKDWMRHMAIADDIIARKLPDEKDNKDEKYEIKVIIDGEAFYLTQLGTGVSQVLPVLVMCLTAEPGSTIIIQNPEEQLHPRVQSKLADFFIAMALSGRQCIIETHSEYLIYALRYRISESLLRNDETIQKATKIYFAEKNNGISEFQEIKVTKRGGISAWPEGFFDERQKLSEKILDAIISEMDDEDA